MSVCVCFVDDKPEVREEFLGIVRLDSADAESISSSLLTFLSNCNLDLSYIRGQGYDGASVMAGKVSGVSARIWNSNHMLCMSTVAHITFKSRSIFLL